MDVETLATKLIENVAKQNLDEVESMLARLDPAITREAARLSLPIMSMMEYALKQVSPAHKLLSYEINTISAFHLAALLGQNDVVVSIIDKDVPVDMGLDSDSTALHLSSFAGQIDTVRLLIDVYNADVNRQDKYGWTALHYASTEGHLSVAKLLISSGAKVDMRDKDGTSAAWRAKLNKHDDIVRYLCELGDEEELLNIEEAEDVADLYTKVDKPKKFTKASSVSQLPSPPEDAVFEYGSVWDANQNRVAKPSTPNPLLRHKSSPAMVDSRPRPQSDIVMSGGLTPALRSQTLPRNIQDMPREARTSTIRRIIRRELDAAFNEYECPVDMVREAGAAADSEEQEVPNVGIGTLKGIMREELDKYRRDMFGGMVSPGGGAGAAAGTDFRMMAESGDYEDLYSTLKTMPQEPPPPPPPREAPPLPPRNPGGNTATPSRNVSNTVPTNQQTPQHNTNPRHSLPENTRQSLIANKIDEANEPHFISGLVKLQLQAPTSMALRESIHKLGDILGKDWVRLVRVLPLHKSTSKVEERIKAIEKSHPKNISAQARKALEEWRTNAGTEAHVDNLMIALRKCGLHQHVEEVDRVACEFTA